MQQLIPKQDVELVSTNPADKLTLVQAVFSNRLDLVKSYVANGADVNAIDEETGFAAIHMAACGRTEIFRYLVEEANADINIKTTGVKKWPTFYYSNNLAVFAKPGCTPLLLAVVNKREDIVIYLCDKDLNLNLETRNNDNETAYFTAVFLNRRKMAELLKNKGADTTITEGQTTLHFAILNLGFQKMAKQYSNYDALEKVLETTPDDELNKRNNYGYTPLARALHIVSGYENVSAEHVAHAQRACLLICQEILKRKKAFLWGSVKKYPRGMRQLVIGKDFVVIEALLNAASDECNPWLKISSSCIDAALNEIDTEQYPKTYNFLLRGKLFHEINSHNNARATNALAQIKDITPRQLHYFISYCKYDYPILAILFQRLIELTTVGSRLTVNHFGIDKEILHEIFHDISIPEFSDTAIFNSNLYQIFKVTNQKGYSLLYFLKQLSWMEDTPERRYSPDGIEMPLETRVKMGDPITFSDCDLDTVEVVKVLDTVDRHNQTITDRASFSRILHWLEQGAEIDLDGMNCKILFKRAARVPEGIRVVKHLLARGYVVTDDDSLTTAFSPAAEAAISSRKQYVDDYREIFDAAVDLKNGLARLTQLLKNNPNIDIDAANPNGQTGLQLAILTENIPVVLWFLNNNANYSAEINGVTVLDLVKETHNPELISAVFNHERLSPFVTKLYEAVKEKNYARLESFSVLTREQCSELMSRACSHILPPNDHTFWWQYEKNVQKIFIICLKKVIDSSGLHGLALNQDALEKCLSLLEKYSFSLSDLYSADKTNKERVVNAHGFSLYYFLRKLDSALLNNYPSLASYVEKNRVLGSDSPVLARRALQAVSPEVAPVANTNHSPH